VADGRFPPGADVYLDSNHGPVWSHSAIWRRHNYREKPGRERVDPGKTGATAATAKGRYRFDIIGRMPGFTRNRLELFRFANRRKTQQNCGNCDSSLIDRKNSPDAWLQPQQPQQ
jgi:hypothetical protein